MDFRTESRGAIFNEGFVGTVVLTKRMPKRDCSHVHGHCHAMLLPVSRRWIGRRLWRRRRVVQVLPLVEMISLSLSISRSRGKFIVREKKTIPMVFASRKMQSLTDGGRLVVHDL